MKHFFYFKIILLLCVLLSCKNQGAGGNARTEDRTIGFDSLLLLPEGGGADDSWGFANEKAVGKAFTLDYSAERPQTLSAYEALADTARAPKGAADGQRIIPGLRKLSEYKTAYFDAGAIERQSMALNTLPAPGNESVFTVVDWGPRDFLSSAVRRPSIFVIFSEPVIPVAALGVPSDTSPFLSIEPPLKGSFRWYGTSFLSFEGSENAQSRQTYTITVNPEAQSLYGHGIQGRTQFTFDTERLSMQSAEPGVEYKKNTGFIFYDDDVPPLAAEHITLTFNYPVRASDIKDSVSIKTDAGGEKQFRLTQIDDYKLLASVQDAIEFNTAVTVNFNDQSVSFRTPYPFVVRDIALFGGWGKYFNVFEIDFSYGLNENTVLGAISTRPAMPLSKENVEVFGNTVRISNLPLGFNEQFEITVAPGIEDVFGRNLTAPYTRILKMPGEPIPAGEASFLDSGHKMLESQFEPRLLFEYKNNTDNSSWTLAAKNNPYGSISIKKDEFRLAAAEKNVRSFQEMDLAPYLNDEGKGFVTFTANIELLTRGVDKETGKQRTNNAKNNLNLQVTDLGVTVRYGFNKTVVLVTSLKTGEPVENALVKLLPVQTVSNSEDISDIAQIENYGQANTGKNGLAVIETAAGIFRDKTRSGNRFWNTAPFVYVEKEKDRALFRPVSHNVWGFGVYAGEPESAERVKPVTFMFSDRGLYKPGETLTFRGVDRTLILGMYAIYKGPYTITLSEQGYGDVIETIQGETSDSGGYYGSIPLNEDLKPGIYSLRYKRDGHPVNADVTINVAYFERLKFQASISPAPATLINGDDINVTVQASYLSGGNLSSASYHASWYRELAAFRPDTIETKDFIFGPRNVYDGKRFVGSFDGVLSANGKAALSQKTGDDSVEGSPYTYSVEAQITDISNQTIAASQSMTVHPARFYIGIENPAASGFAKAGDTLDFKYITVDPNGELIANNAPFLAKGDDARRMTIELIREEWKRVQQRGVQGYIYDNYERELIIDSSETIAINPSGSISVKPSRAGFYTLRLSGFDRDGRKVISERTFYATGSGWGYWNTNNSEEIRLTPDKAVYNPGDTAQVLMQSTLPRGSYLITVEREGIFTEEVRTFDESVSVIEIPLARNYVPVVYVSVSSYSVRSGPPSHTYGSPDLDKPKGYYGVAKIFVNPLTRAFSVKVESDKKVFRPGEEVTLTLIAERNGKPLPDAELTLMAVDRGILDLINYHVPDPIDYFYNERLFPLSVRGGDSRALLMDPVTYSVKNLSGGDSGNKIEERSDFNPTAVFEPMLKTDEKGRVTCTFRLPDTLTTYRITVFGVCGDLFSLKESEIAARNSINVQQVQPRRLRERDTAEAGVLISNLDSASHKIKVALGIAPPAQKTNDESGLALVEGSAFVDGPAEHGITLKSGENAVVYFDVAAKKQGKVNLVYTITSDILNERLVQEITIEKPYVKETVTTTGTVSGNGATEALVIPGYADDGKGSVTISLDATRLSLLKSAVDYLFHYPYGCLEQRSAAILPLVVFGEYIDALNLNSEVADPQRVVERELGSWAKSARPDGGFPYWPDGLRSDMYVSLRIAHIVALAQEKNITIPDSFDIESLYRYLNNEFQKLQRLTVQDWHYASRDYLGSYMLYVFSLLKKPVEASRVAGIVSRNKDNAAVLSFAGMTYRNIKRIAESSSVAQTLRNLLRPTARGVDLTSAPVNNYFYFDSRVERLALTLQFFVNEYPGDQINNRLVYSLLESKNALGFWNNTAVTVRVLSAIDELIKKDNLSKTNVHSIVTLDGRELMNETFSGLNAKSLTRNFDFKAFPLAAMPRDSLLPLKITREGTGNMYWTAQLSYMIPEELQGYRDEGIGVFLSVSDAESDAPVEDNQLESGKLYRATVRVSSGRDRNYLALRVPLPSGAEILDASFVTTTAEASDINIKYPQDVTPINFVSNQFIYDNEIQYFYDSFAKGEARVQFLFRAARRGVYPTPPVQAECMYEGEIFGRSPGILWTIK
jgi:uncharacterized protein YfaS (alpha-2-macroglobulin family)